MQRNRTLCAVQPPMNELEAARTARQVERSQRINTSVVYCERCDSYHITAKVALMRMFDQDLIAILEKSAQGLTYREIADDIKKTIHYVHSRVIRARMLVGALSVGHLLVLATCLGIIDPLQFLPKVTEDQHGEPNANIQ